VEAKEENKRKAMQAHLEQKTLFQLITIQRRFKMIWTQWVLRRQMELERAITHQWWYSKHRTHWKEILNLRIIRWAWGKCTRKRKR
jgi:hypothetical protein